MASTLLSQRLDSVLDMSINNRKRRAEKRKKAQARNKQSSGRTSHATWSESPNRESQDVEQRVHNLVVKILRSSNGKEFDPGLVRQLQRQPSTTLGNALSNNLQRLVELVWDNGWQPADVVRYVRNKCSDMHCTLLVDVIAAESVAYDTPNVDVNEDWMRQLESIGIELWWSDHHDLFSQWRLRHDHEESDAIVIALSVLFHLSSLPRLEFICPPPSKWARGPGIRALKTSHMTLDEEGQRMLTKVRALLAKAESTSFEEEAESLTAKAQELMARYAIDQAMLHATEIRSGERHPISRRIGVEDPYASVKTFLLHVVAKANNCRSISCTHAYFSSVVGFKEDLETVELLYMSLLVQATSAMTKIGSVKDNFGRSRTTSFRKSFLYSFAVRIGERLEEVQTGAVKDAQADSLTHGANLLPVLASKKKAVEEEFDRLFPNVSKSNISITNHEGWEAGHAAANAAVLDIRDAVSAG